MAAMANADVLTDADVIVEETTKAEAEAMGALAFFGDKYGEQVRVVRAGPHSIELCGGTHVGALGMIGPITVISESSIGSNTRRLFAVTGTSAFDRIVEREGLLTEAAALLRTEPEHVLEAIDRLLERQRAAERSFEQARGRELQAEASALAADGGGRDRGGPPRRARARRLARPGPGHPDQRRTAGGGARREPRRHQGRAGRVGRPLRRPTPSTPGTWSSRSPRCSAAAAGARRRWPWPGARTRRASTGPSTRPARALGGD